jgi:hypothetical protein
MDPLNLINQLSKVFTQSEYKCMMGKLNPVMPGEGGGIGIDWKGAGNAGQLALAVAADATKGKSDIKRGSETAQRIASLAAQCGIGTSRQKAFQIEVYKLFGNTKKVQQLGGTPSAPSGGGSGGGSSGGDDNSMLLWVALGVGAFLLLR